MQAAPSRRERWLPALSWPLILPRQPQRSPGHLPSGFGKASQAPWGLSQVLWQDWLPSLLPPAMSDRWHLSSSEELQCGVFLVDLRQKRLVTMIPGCLSARSWRHRGSSSTGVFATKFINPGADGLLHGNPGQMLNQMVAVVVTWLCNRNDVSTFVDLVVDFG